MSFHGRKHFIALLWKDLANETEGVNLRKKVLWDRLLGPKLQNLLRLCIYYNGTARFFTFSLIIEGTTEKVPQLKMPVKSINKKTLGSLNKKCYIEHYKEVQTVKIYSYLYDLLFCTLDHFIAVNIIPCSPQTV